MTFYLKPPQGLAFLKNLEDTVQERQTFYQNSTSENIRDIILQLECLCEDKVLDRLSHYIFRFAATQNGRFADVFIKNEVKLLEVRLACYSEDDVKFMLKKLKKHALDTYLSIQFDGEVKKFIVVLLRVAGTLLEKQFFKHAFQEHQEQCEDCDKFLIKVRFELCPDLLVSRQYMINQGCLLILSFQWKYLLLSLYKYYLKLMLKHMKYSGSVKSALEDERIRDIVRTILKPYSNRQHGNFTLDHFNLEHTKFPPCMRNLYEVLNVNNRLSHNARFDFSLYLKDIGLSLEDSLIFWEDTYSKPHTSCSKCSHNWEDNRKRYIYGIRHLYGLEGARRCYNVKSCQALQEQSLSANEEGGCPFIHSDDEHLRKMLKRFLTSQSYDQIEVIIYEKRGNPKVGCELFFAEFARTCLNKEFCGDVVNFYDPAQYYFLAKNS